MTPAFLQAYYDNTVRRTMVHKDLGADHPTLRRERALGLAAEAGEVADLVKKWATHGLPFDRKAMISELGDVAWYICANALTYRDPEDPESHLVVWSTRTKPNSDERAEGVVGAAIYLAASACSVGMCAKERLDLSDGSAFVMGRIQFVAEALRLLLPLLPGDISIEEVMEANAAKLAVRHKDGFNPRWKSDTQGDLAKAARVLLKAYQAHLLEGGYRHAPASAVDDLEAALQRVEVANGQ